MEQKVLRFSTLMVAGALVLRLLSGGSFGRALGFALSPETASWIIFFQTGRLVRPDHITFDPAPTTPAPEPAPPPTAAPTAPALPVFSPADADTITVSSSFSYGADLSALVTQPLHWDLTGDAPTVLIVHSHGTESFLPTGAYTESSPYHTLDSEHNMVSIGAYVAELLTAGGLTVLQDTAIHDSPSYDASYANSRASVQAYLEKYPSIQLVLDLHRDSYEDAAGNQTAHTVFSDGTTLAQLMFVVGTDYGGLTHPEWQENLALALKLQTQLERLCPGICRNVNLRTQRFNQDLSPGALLIEVGASGNTYAEAIGAAKVLAEAILTLSHGSQ